MNYKPTAIVLLVLLFVGSITRALENCLFCRIVERKEPAKIIAENDDILVFESNHPRYPSHWLIIPKKHIQDIKTATTQEEERLLGKLLAAARDLGKQLLGSGSFNLAFNTGAQAGQTIFHLHGHFYSQDSLKTSSPKI